MFIDAIGFLNNVGDIHKALTNIKENNVDPLKLIQAVVNIGNYLGIEDKISLNIYTLSLSVYTFSSVLDNVHGSCREQVISNKMQYCPAGNIEGKYSSAPTTYLGY